MNKPSELSKYLSYYLRNWMKTRELTFTAASMRLGGLDVGQIHGLTNMKRGVSLERLEEICLRTGKPPLEALSIGKSLSENEKSCSSEKFQETFQEPFETEIEALRICLSDGGDDTELIREMILKLADKKRETTAIKEAATATLAKESNPGSRRTKGNEAAR